MSTTKPTTPPVPREEIAGFEDLQVGKKWPTALKFEAMNKPQTLTVTELERTQDRTFDPKGGPGVARTWPDKTPMMVLVVIGADADGVERSHFIKGRLATAAFREALSEKGYKGLATGDVLTVDWIGEEPVIGEDGKPMTDSRGPILAKVYSYEIG